MTALTNPDIPSEGSLDNALVLKAVGEADAAHGYRMTRAERALMIVELQLDGMKTHVTMRRGKCPLWSTDIDLKIRVALSATRSARDLFREVIGIKQHTLTTRSASANRHGRWFMRVVRTWKCPYCHVGALERVQRSFTPIDHVGLGTDACLLNGPGEVREWLEANTDFDGQLIDMIVSKELDREQIVRIYNGETLEDVIDQGLESAPILTVRERVEPDYGE